MVNPVTLIKQDLLTRLFIEPVKPVTPVPDSGQETSGFLQGEKYQAIVESRLSNGNFRITVAGQNLQVALPGTTQPGDRLNLLLVEKEPRLQFVSLNDSGNQNSKELSISTTGRFLGTLTQEGGKSPAANTLTATAPLLAFPPDDSAPLPGLLQQSVSRSGLFYESHQAQWINGKTTLEELKQEPQARLAGPGATNGATSADNQTRTILSANTMQESTLTGVGQPRSMTEAATTASTQHTALVQQQLAVLETGQVNWRGEIWPGQLLEWDIAEKHPQPDQESDTNRQWHTRLKLTLPNLGEVSAILMLDTQGIRIRLSASENNTSDLMKQHQQPLVSAMTAAGMNILAMDVEK